MARRREHPIDVPAAFAAWKAGTSIGVLAEQYKCHRPQLYHPFVKLAGSVEAYHTLRAQGAGGERVVNIGERSAQRAAEGLPQVDDSKVRRIDSTLTADGWRSEQKLDVEGYGYTVYISPNFERYVKARSVERADLIVDNPVTKHGRGPVRLRYEETSSNARKERLNLDLLAHAAKADAAKEAAKVEPVASVAVAPVLGSAKTSTRKAARTTTRSKPTKSTPKTKTRSRK